MRIKPLLAAAAFAAVAHATTASATICIVPDNGSGTANLPPNCSSGYLSPSDVHMIINGLPPPQTIDIGVEHSDFLCPGTLTICSFPPPGVCSGGSNAGNPCAGMTSCPGGICVPDCDQPGGTLGGEEECHASNVKLTMNGTNGLVYNRIVNMPVQFETHIAPRTLGDAVQSFDTAMMRLQGQLPPGDPDFDLLRITAGNDFGLPSPGHTTLTRTSATPGANWNVDSFFDITYRIDFIGHSPGPFSGMSGSTTGTIRMQAGEPAVFDHLECLKPKDTVKLKAVADLIAPGLYASSGCKLGNAVNYCRPAIKQVVSSNVPVVPVPGQNLTHAFVCYKMKCPKVAITQAATDQFGSRTLTKLKHQQLCVPATP